MEILKVENLTKIYGKDMAKVTALDEENITLPLALDNREVDKHKLDEMIKLLGLENRKTHLPNELSGGQQQRTSIGRALITSPTIMITHNMEIAKCADRIIKIEDGKIVREV